MKNIREHNRLAWDRESANGNPATIPVQGSIIEAALKGDWSLSLMGNRKIPKSWFPKLKGSRILALAAGGGQQASVLSAAGADVLLLDNSPSQLDRDRQLAEQFKLPIEIREGDMRDLSGIGKFDLVLLPLSNQFIPDVGLLWKEIYKVLVDGGRLIAAFVNPVDYMFDPEKREEGSLELRFPLPYSDLDSVSEKERDQYWGKLEPLEFGHTLESQIGGQLQTGLSITEFFEDSNEDDFGKHMATYYVTMARKWSKE